MSLPSESIVLRLNTATHAAGAGDSRIADFIFERARQVTEGRYALELRQDAGDPNVWYFIGLSRVIEDVRVQLHYLNRTPCVGLTDPKKGLLKSEVEPVSSLPQNTIRRRLEGALEEELDLPWLGAHPTGEI